MKTLKQSLRRAWSEQDTDMILKYVQEWLQQKRKQFEKGDLILTDLGVVDELLEELEQK